MSEGHQENAVGAEVHDNPFEGRYEIRLDGRTAGFTTYKSKPDLIAFLHTEIDSSLEGCGLGSTLVGSALDDARERGLEVLPLRQRVHRSTPRRVCRSRPRGLPAAVRAVKRHRGEDTEV